ncbi:hypothetical protein [Tautonia sociabilis]|uniref:Uncharacterized protein n=1 Tax=Tautonia sociabilis TaxID=2080755 RepID=A0A432ME30_9BACT|nr:hypothetical protein [Tautonia sociabilis]RUL83407.1 hypothetical protein TsocGM_22105 [Tautonia sociabilis]
MNFARKYGPIAAGSLLVLVSLAFAAQQGPGILFPDWSEPTKGTWDNPAAELGKEVTGSRPWSITTYTSAIEGKVLEGKPMTVVGEIVDLSCYLQVGKRGDKHRDCGQKCALQGQPIGLLTEDGSLFLLMDEEHNPRRDGLTNFRKAAIEHMAYVVKVHGTFSEVAGQKALYVQGYLTEG